MLPTSRCAKAAEHSVDAASGTAVSKERKCVDLQVWLQRRPCESYDGQAEEREVLLMKDIEDTKAKHAFAQAEFETERDELNDLVTKSRLLLQVSYY